jgi:hypothetical protein
MLKIQSVEAGDFAPSCVKVISTESEQCSQLKVLFDLSQCRSSVQKIKGRIKCASAKPFAEGQMGQIKLQVKLIKSSSDEWNSNGSQNFKWRAASEAKAFTTSNSKRKLEKSDSLLVSLKKENLTPVPSFNSPIQRTPAMIRPNEPVPEAKQEGVVKISGFLDAQYIQNDHQELTRGFLINDGALYLTTTTEGVDFKIDLPFRMFTQNSPNFDLGLTKAQAFVGQKLSNGFRWKVGQFDTSFGFEGNDTVDVLFTRQGSVYNFTDPFVHTGMLLGYDFNSELGLNFYMDNPNDRGVLTGKNIQYGLQLVDASSTSRFSAGFLVNQDPTTQEMNYYLDVTSGITMASFSIDTELSYNKRYDLPTPESSTTQGLGVLLQFAYTFTESLSFGSRTEYVTQLALPDPRGIVIGGPLKSQVLSFFGIQYSLTKGIRLKFDYSYQKDLYFVTSESEVANGFQMASVFRF